MLHELLKLLPAPAQHRINPLDVIFGMLDATAGTLAHGADLICQSIHACATGKPLPMPNITDSHECSEGVSRVLCWSCQCCM